MKRMKKLIALMVAMEILCISVVPAFAVDSKEDLSQAFKKLEHLCWEAVYDYGISSDDFDCEYKAPPGTLCIYITEESWVRGVEVLHESNNLMNDYIANKKFGMNTYTVEDFEKQYDKFYKALNSLVVSKLMLKKLISFCLEEQNHNNYYRDEVWTEFCEKISNAQAIYDDAEIIEDFVVTETYFELLNSHFKLCSSNTMFGDVDNDGSVSVLDATYVQLACAQRMNFNSSQLVVAKKDITYATDIQLYVASLSDSVEFKNSELDNYINYTVYSDIHSKEFRFKSWKYNYFYVDKIRDRKNPYYLQEVSE